MTKQKFPGMLHNYNIEPDQTSLSKRLLEPGRFDDFSVAFGDLMLDFSRTSISPAALERMLELASASGVEESRTRLFNAEDINFTEQRPALHMAMRSESVLENLDANMVAKVRENRQRMIHFADAFAAGHLPEQPAAPVRNIIHIGIGGSVLGPRLLIEALGSEDSPYVHFLSSVDAHLREDLLAKLDPAETAVIVATKSFTTGETLLHARRVSDWMEQALGRDAMLQRLFAVSGNQKAVDAFGISHANTLYLPDWVGGRYSL